MGQLNLFVPDRAQADAIHATPQRQVGWHSEGMDLRLAAKACWMRNHGRFATCEELATHVAESLGGLNVSTIRAWRSFYEWPNPELSQPADSEGARFWRIEEDDDPYAHAHDPLEDFYAQYRMKAYRKYMNKYVTITGYNSPSEVDLTEIQAILDQHPITLEKLAIAIGQESDIFPTYARAKGIVEPPHAQVDVPIGTLIFHHQGFASFVIRHLQHLYHHRGITIRILAGRLGLNWQDLWLLGVRLGYWRLPTPQTFTEMDTCFRRLKQR